MRGDSETPAVTDHRDPLFLFVCHLEWHSGQNLAAYEELLAALDDPDQQIRVVAEVLLQRSSPRPRPRVKSAEGW